MTMIEVMCCPINYLHEAVVSLTKPLEWSKTKAAVSLSSNCTAASENSRREGTCSQPTGDESWEKEREGMDGITHETAEEGFRQREEGGGHGGSQLIFCLQMRCPGLMFKSCNMSWKSMVRLLK